MDVWCGGRSVTEWAVVAATTDNKRVQRVQRPPLAGAERCCTAVKVDILTVGGRARRDSRGGRVPVGPTGTDSARNAGVDGHRPCRAPALPAPPPRGPTREAGAHVPCEGSRASGTAARRGSRTGKRAVAGGDGRLTGTGPATGDSRQGRARDGRRHQRRVWGSPRGTPDTRDTPCTHGTRGRSGEASRARQPRAVGDSRGP